MIETWFYAFYDVEYFVVLYSMKIKIRIGDVDANRTEVHQIKSKAFDFGFRRLLKTIIDSQRVRRYLFESFLTIPWPTAPF